MLILRDEMNWLEHFTKFFEQRKDRITRILDAGGCREGWLQGEFFLHSPDGMLQTNCKREKFDLASDNHPMLAEIKICGGDYQAKMSLLIEADVAKLKGAQYESEKFMILLIDTRQQDTVMGRWLLGFTVKDAIAAAEVSGESWTAKIWKIADNLTSSTLEH